MKNRLRVVPEYVGLATTARICPEERKKRREKKGEKRRKTAKNGKKRLKTAKNGKKNVGNGSREGEKEASDNIIERQ